jgi:hypothetical protein
MGIMDRDYMRERHRGADRASPPRGLGRVAGDDWTGWVSRAAVFVMVGAAVYAAVSYWLDRKSAAPFPQSGDARWYVTSEAPRVAMLTLQAPMAGDRNFVVRLDDWSTGVPIVTIPVRARESAVTLLPLGRYRMTISKGTTWRGRSGRFGMDGETREVVDPIEFYAQGSRITGQRIQLEVPFGGNLETRPSLQR